MFKKSGDVRFDKRAGYNMGQLHLLLDFSLWVYLKNNVHREKLTVEDIKKRIKKTCVSIPYEMIHKALDSYSSKLCIVVQGNNFEHSA